MFIVFIEIVHVKGGGPCRREGGEKVVGRGKYQSVNLSTEEDSKLQEFLIKFVVEEPLL